MNRGSARGRRPRPPALARWLLVRILPGGDGMLAAGDLEEEYVTFVVPERGRWRADLWYWRQVLLSVPGASLRGSSARRVPGDRESPKRGGRPWGSWEGLKRTGGGGMEGIVQDVRYVLRGLRKRPGFTAVAVVTLALGIGANTAIFSLVEGVLLRPLPYDDPSTLVRLVPDRLFPFGKVDVLAIEEGVESFVEVAGWSRDLFLLTGEDDPEEVRGAAVFANHFSMLGARPILGRWFLPEDGEVGAEPVVIVSHGLWERRYGADPDVVGRRIRVGGILTTVIGVMPPEHQPIESDWQLWAPLTRDPEVDGDRGMAANARLRPQVGISVAQAELRQAARKHSATFGHELTEDEVTSLSVAPLRSWLLGDTDRPLLVLLGAVAFVLLIACANVANLLLALGGARERDLAVRLAMGARRGRLVRMLLIESGILGVLGGAAGVLTAWWAVRVGIAYLPAQIPRAQNIGMDPQVLAFALLATVGAAIVSGLSPALRLTRGDLARRIHTARVGTGGRGHTHRLLVTAEVAVAVVLVIGAGLMLRSFWQLEAIDPGFRADGVVTMRPAPPSARYPSEQELEDYYARVMDEVERLPRVISVGAIQFLPMSSGAWWSTVGVPERPRSAQDQGPQIAVRVVTPDYFHTMGIPVLRGRVLSAVDGRDGSDAVVVNRAFAESVGAGWDPVGRELTIGDGQTRYNGCRCGRGRAPAESGCRIGARSLPALFERSVATYVARGEGRR